MRKHAAIIVVLIIAAVFALDRFTKALIEDAIPYAQGIDVTGFFSLVHARNFGGVWGILQGYEYARQLFTYLPLLIVGVIIYILVRYAMTLPKIIALSLVLGGAAGNMHDRIRYGYVVDFLDFYWKGYHWPAFNVADIAISCGIILWLYLELFEKTPEAPVNGKGV